MLHARAARSRLRHKTVLVLKKPLRLQLQPGPGLSNLAQEGLLARMITFQPFRL